MNKRKRDFETKNSNQKLQIIRQICDKGVDIWLSDTEIFLSPQNLCSNFRNRIQYSKPKTPASAPDKALRKILREKGR